MVDAPAYLNEILVPPDGLPAREALLHSRDKLGILSYYIPGFATACKDKAPEFFFVDGFGGEGLYSFPDDRTYAIGSTLIALRRASPPFTKTLSLELDEVKCDLLRQRCEPYGARSVVRLGDCNRDLLPAMEREIKRRAPILALLDPNAFELEWSTVRDVAAFRSGARTEMLILVATGRVLRASSNLDPFGLPVAAPVTRAFPPNSKWKHIVAAYRRGDTSSEQARERLAADYADGLRSLGYGRVFHRAITNPGRAEMDDGSTVYHLLFATDNETGEKIMAAAFERVYTNQIKTLRVARQRGQGYFGDLF